MPSCSLRPNAKVAEQMIAAGVEGRVTSHCPVPVGVRVAMVEVYPLKRRYAETAASEMVGSAASDSHV